MTLEREAKRIERAIRKVPVEAIAPTIAGYEASERWLLCLVAEHLEFVHVDGRRGETTWCDTLEVAQIVRWLRAYPERVHPTYPAALTFVRTRLTD